MVGVKERRMGPGAAAAAGVLVLGAVLLGSLGARSSTEGEIQSPRGRELVVSIRSSGGGMVRYYRQLELWSDGTLDLSRRAASGGEQLQRRATLTAEAAAGYRKLLEDAGYFSAPEEQFQAEIVERSLRVRGDHITWRIEVERTTGDRFGVSIPQRSLKRYAPELEEIPFVRVGWQLIEELFSNWDSAEAVAP